MICLTSLFNLLVLLLLVKVANALPGCDLNQPSDSLACADYCYSKNCVIGYCSENSCRCEECAPPVNAVISATQNESDDYLDMPSLTTNVFESDEDDMDTNTLFPKTINSTTVATKWFAMATASVICSSLVLCVLLTIVLAAIVVSIRRKICQKHRKSTIRDQFDLDDATNDGFALIKPNHV